MMQPLEFVNKAGACVKQAQEAEKKGSLNEALQSYQQALSIFNTLLRNKQCAYLVEKITPYANDCLVRAQQIQEALRNNEPLPTCNNTGSNSVPQGARLLSSPEQQTNNDEKLVMMQQLAQTRVDPATLNITWDDIVGLEGVKRMLDEVIRLPREMPQLFVGNRSVARSVLLYGPPGTGKTLLGKALACVSGIPFYSVSSAELISKYVGESEKYIKCLFETVKNDSPCVLFLDEVEALCGKREDSGHSGKTVNQFLTQLDGINQSGSMDGVFVLACTNLPWALDGAMRRRLERRVYIPLPTSEEREALIKHYVSKNDHMISEKLFRELACKTEYYSSADISLLCKTAAMVPVNKMALSTHFLLLENGGLMPCGANEPDAWPMLYKSVSDKTLIVLPPIRYSDFIESLERIKSSVDVKKLNEYVEWTKAYGSVY